MRITIHGKDFKPSSADQEYVIAKLSKLEKFYPHINRIGVELDVDHNVTKGQKYRIEVWVALANRDVKAGLKAEHFQEAVNLVYPKLERQLTRLKERRNDRRKPWATKSKQHTRPSRRRNLSGL